MKKYIIALMFMICLVPQMCGAADWYVLKSASGSNNGSDWTNAWNEMDQIAWSSISAGDTIWLGGGTYTTQLNIQKSGTSQARIYVKRVRSTDAVPAAAAGWNAAFDSQVIINHDPVAISWSASSGVGSYVTLDGQIEDGIRAYVACGAGARWDTSSIRVETDQVRDIVIQYIDAAGPGVGEAFTHGNECVSITLYVNGGKVYNPTIRHNKLHGNVVGTRILGQDGGVWEYNEYYHNDTSTDWHSNSFTIRQCYNKVTIRYNIFHDYTGEGIMLGAMDTDISCPVEVYGNLFHTGLHNIGGEDTSSRALELQYMPWTVKFYNNTIYDLQSSLSVVQAGAEWGSGSEVKNNIFYSVGTPVITPGSPTVTHNAFSSAGIAKGTDTQIMSSDPFTNAGSYDFTLKAATVAGATLSSPYNIDMAGNVRGADSTWDRGAYEYTGTPAPDTDTPDISGNPTINAAGTQLTIPYDETVTVNNSGGFMLACDKASGEGLIYTSGSGTTTLIYAITGATIETDETCTLDYATVANGIEDQSGNDMESIGDPIAVDNNSSYTPTTSSWTVTPSTGIGCGISPNTPVSVTDGLTTSFTCAANIANYECVAWVGTCGSTGSTSMTTSAITGDCTVVQPCYKQTPSIDTSGCKILVGVGPAIQVK